MQINHLIPPTAAMSARRAGLVTVPSLLAGVLLLVFSQALAARAQSWTLQWSDEFNAPAGTYPDAKSWTYDTGNGGFGNPEIENYCVPGSSATPCAASQPNAYQDGRGNLVITAIRNGAGQWTSARLKTQGRVEPQYGRIEARMKLPVGDGFWPAFWMLGADIESAPWPRCGEQDIMEWVQSYGPATTSSTTHGPGYSGAQGIGAWYTFPHGGRTDDGNFHIYGVIWSPNSLQYYRDSPGNVFETLTPAKLPAGAAWVFNHPFYILLNLAIGNGGFPGSTDGSTPSTATMLVDYVRVFRLERAGSGMKLPVTTLDGVGPITVRQPAGAELRQATR